VRFFSIIDNETELKIISKSDKELQNLIINISVLQSLKKYNSSGASNPKNGNKLR
jgi:hypothetical protein